MAGHTTMKRDGGWSIELITPLVGGVTQLDIKPLTLDHTIRWSRKEIPSVLALLEELCGVKEVQLKQLTGADSDRALMAFSVLASPQIRDDYNSGRRPLATAYEDLTPEQQYDVTAADNDPEDPRFPRIEGDYVPYKAQPPSAPQQQTEPQQPPQTDRGGLDIDPPEVMRKVG